MSQIPQIRQGGRATITWYSPFIGLLKKEVSKFSVAKPRPSGRFTTLLISCTELDMVNVHGFEPTSAFGDFCIIEMDGKVIYDSRLEIPCDMTKWQARYDEKRAEWLKRKARNEWQLADFSQRDPLSTLTSSIVRPSLGVPRTSNMRTESPDLPAHVAAARQCLMQQSILSRPFANGRWSGLFAWDEGYGGKHAGEIDAHG